MAGDERVVSEFSRLYRRELPGGGYVSIEVMHGVADDAELVTTAVERRGHADRRVGHEPPTVTLVSGRPCRARLCVERRSDDDRRSGHVPPVIAEAECDTAMGAFNELYEIARDNAAIARGLLSWQAERRG